MTPNGPEELRTWLRAEADGRVAEADRSCRRTFQQLPAAPLPAGMKDRIVAAVVEALPRRRDPFKRPLIRMIIAASFLVAAVVAGGLPTALAGAGRQLTVGSFIDFLRTALTAVSSLAASMPGLWNYVVDFAQLGTSAAASPVFLLAFAALAGASLVTFRVLSDLTFRQKGLSHVDAV